MDCFLVWWQRFVSRVARSREASFPWNGMTTISLQSSWKSSREERLEVLVLLFCICIAFADPDSALLVRGWGYKPKSRHATPTMFFLWSGSMELHGISICGWLYYVCNSRIVTLQCDRTHSSPPGGKMKRLICTSTGVQNLVECRRTN